MNSAAASGDLLVLSDADINKVFDWAAASAALRAAYAAGSNAAMFPPRAMARGEGVWLRAMSAVDPGGAVMGAKLIAASMRAHCASYLIALFDQKSSALTALLDGASITGFRTAAASALAARTLANGGPLRVALIGSGFEAQTHLRALAAQSQIEEAVVFSPRAESRARFMREMAVLKLNLRAANSVEAAAQGANLIVCAARSRDETPTFTARLAQPGQTIISIGSTLPEQRELDADLIARADLIFADMVEEIAHDTGDMLAAKTAGIEFDHKLFALGDVIGGRHGGRAHADQIVIYKSVGAAIQDIAVATMCWRRAAAAGLGAALPGAIGVVDKGG